VRALGQSAVSEISEVSENLDSIGYARVPLSYSGGSEEKEI
jgi:hypothetical protein